MEQDDTYKGIVLTLVQWREEQVSLSSLIGFSMWEASESIFSFADKGLCWPHQIVAVGCDDIECPILYSSYVVHTDIS